MRTIKFRGKPKKTGDWLVGDIIHYGKTICVAPIDADWFDFVSKNRLINGKYEVIPETVGQFTGLTDKNGKEIFEGDIVKWDDNSKSAYWRVCVISWENSHYKLTGYTYSTGLEEIKRPVDFKFGQFIYEYDDVLEVIGNIHDNPELLQN